MAQGSRQNLIARSVVATSGGTKTTITADRTFVINRIKLLPNDGTLPAMASQARVRIRAEGEDLYSGVQLPVQALFVKTEDSAAVASECASPWVLAFDTPLSLSKDYPIEIELSNTTETFWIILEGPAAIR